MKEDRTLSYQFVEFIPEELVESTLYISIKYKTMAHLCLCGCKSKIVTPLSPTGWNFAYDGRTITVRPSVGNWQLACRSHYIISRSQVIWCDNWSDDEIEYVYDHDQQEKSDYYNVKHTSSLNNPGVSKTPSVKKYKGKKQSKWWQRNVGNKD